MWMNQVIYSVISCRFHSLFPINFSLIQKYYPENHNGTNQVIYSVISCRFHSWFPVKFSLIQKFYLENDVDEPSNFFSYFVSFSLVVSCKVFFNSVMLVILKTTMWTNQVIYSVISCRFHSLFPVKFSLIH